MRGVPDKKTILQDGFDFEYWLITLHLLEKGLPWEIIHSMTIENLVKVLGITKALADKEQQDNDMIQRGMMNKGSFR